MTGTYRQTMVFTYDGFEHTRRRAKTRSQMKPIDRRIKRREHHDVTREAVHSYYADGADDFYNHLYGDDYMEDYFDNRFMEPEWDEHEGYIEDDFDYGDPMDYYDPFENYDPFDDYHDIWGTSPVTPEDTRRIEREDIGKSLGDILQEMLDKRSGL